MWPAPPRCLIKTPEPMTAAQAELIEKAETAEATLKEGANRFWDKTLNDSTHDRAEAEAPTIEKDENGPTSAKKRYSKEPADQSRKAVRVEGQKSVPHSGNFPC